MTPEKIVEKEVLALCRELEFDVDIIDSKAVFSQKARTYVKSKSAPEGISDLVGNTQNGLAVFIELKAKGERKTLRPAQRVFLERKISAGCFACCVDSAKALSEIYLKFITLSPIERVTYLRSVLP